MGRWIDTRTVTNQSIFRLQHAVTKLFREFLDAKDFIEIHTPKLLYGASEGGADMFSTNYFGLTAALAQSPQLHKQISCANSGFDRVYEIGPVFRAEKSFTHRHLCEFVGLDLEMTINEHYFEVLDLFSDLFIYIFDNLAERYSKELAAINTQHPFEPLVYQKPSLRITFAEGVKMLNEAGFEQSYHEDLDTEKEKALGRLVKEEYNTDFYMMYEYPRSARPFYTMPHPTDPNLTNSYDMFIGEIKNKGIDPESLKFYVDSFKYGSLPHGGGGIGLERVVMLYLNLHNIRKASLFPRDPKRLA